MESAEVILARIDQRLGFLVLSHNELKEEIKPVIDDVKKIKNHLYIDDLTGDDGLIKRVHKVEVKVEQILKDRLIDKKVNAALATAITLAVTLVWKLVQLFFKL